MKEALSLEKAPALIAFFSAGVLAISITYDFGYLTYLGLSFSETPTTLADHIRSSLVWIPSTIIMIFGMLALELLNRRIEQGMTEEELIKTSPTPKLTAWFRDSPKYPIMAFALFIPVSPFIGIDLPLQAWMFGLVVLWTMLHNFFFNHERILHRTTKLFYLASRWVPAVIIFVSFLGAIAAEKVPDGKRYVFEMGENKKTVVLARSYDKYYLVWNTEAQAVEFLSASSVTAFYPLSEPKANKSSKSDSEKRAAS